MTIDLENKDEGKAGRSLLSLGSLADVAFIGVGGCGANILEFLALRLSGDACLVAINNDKARLRTQTPIFFEQVLLVGELTSQRASEVIIRRHLFELENKIADYQFVCLLTGLGGKVGSWVTAILAQRFKTAGKTVLVVAVKPFDFEMVRQERADKAIEELSCFEGLLLFSNQQLITATSSEISMQDLFLTMNEAIFKALLQVIKQNGAIK